MKKLILTLLLGLLLFSVMGLPHGIAEDTSQLYYLWDIPFGISESEFIKQVYAKTGFNFVPHSGEAEDPFHITTDESQSISFLGHPLREANASFHVDINGNTSYYRLSLLFDVESKTIPEALPLFDSVRLALMEKYGAPAFAALSTTMGKFVTCDAIEGNFDAQQVADILVGDDTVRILGIGWRNIEIYVGKTDYNGTAMMLLSSVSPQEIPSPLESYENRNAPSDAGL